MNTIWYDYEKHDKSRGTAIAIGNFDGLHKGHAQIMSTLKKVSKEKGLSSLCYTFSEHPVNVIKGDDSLPLIANNNQKENFFKQEGIDCLFFEDFRRVKDLSAKDFVKDVLISKLNMKVVVAGLHNHFGKNGEGDIDLLRELGQKYGFLVYALEPLYYSGVICSSTKIREYLKKGEIEKANTILGRNYTVCGTVVKGKELGTKLGFPTANIMPQSNMLIPHEGVYATSVSFHQKTYKSITNVGTCPTVNDNSIKFETHILDFDTELYGKTLEISFITKMRETLNFENIDSLKKQLLYDVTKRKKIG
ncbi:MAG: bifunctional riboflavin kinase/FAD synthetase [Ruminococcaceae bacterium]|nr:bifunctional riboflavin kinase/FAD synthetase [Oscillospiraceae bacterium]